MRYAIVAIASVFFGFVGAWLVFNRAVDSAPNPRPGSVSAPQAVTTSASMGQHVDAPVSGHEALTFESIVASPSVFRQQLMAWQLAAGSTIPELEAYIDRSIEISDPLFHSNIVTILLERYVELDPRAAMAFVTSDFRLNQNEMQSHVITSWVRYDPEAAIDYFRQIPDQGLKLSIGRRLLQDPILANTGLDREVETILGPHAAQLREQIAMQQSDPVTLFNEAMSMTGHDRHSRMMYAINRWVAVDPEAALARLQNLPRDQYRQSIMQVAISRYAQKDPDAALAYLHTNLPDETQLQGQVIGVMAQHDISRALAAAEDLNQRAPNTGVLNAVISTWAQQDPSAAISYIDAMQSPRKQELYSQVAFAYLSRHPREGLEWALNLPPEYDQVRRSAIHMISRDNIDLAESALTRSTESNTRDSLINAIARFKAQSDPDAALAWLSDYSRDRGYAAARRHIISVVATHDPARAASLAGNESDTNTIMSIAHHWYQQDPDAAMRWLESRTDPRDRDAAMASIVGMLAHTDLERAIALVSEMSASDMKNNAAQSVAFSWLRREPDQLERIISTLGLSEAQADALREAAERQDSFIISY